MATVKDSRSRGKMRPPQGGNRIRTHPPQRPPTTSRASAVLRVSPTVLFNRGWRAAPATNWMMNIVPFEGTSNAHY
jgi:hypothetical protein